MLRYDRSIGPIQNSNIFVSPHIVKFDRRLETHITHLQRDWRLQFSTVEQGHGLGTIRERFRPYLQRANGRQTVALNAQGILIDSDRVAVLEDC
jgi:hypothetical protein